MNNKWITINNKTRFSQLRRVGDLQSYGIPLVSLFYDIKEKLLYLALSVYKRENTTQYIIKNHYDILDNAKWLEKFYENEVNKYVK